MTNSNNIRTASGHVVIGQLNSEGVVVPRTPRGSTRSAQRLAFAVLGGLTWFAAAATVRAQTTCPTPGNATTACSGGNCAAIAVGSATGPANGTVQIPITFTQGPSDSQAGQGFDEVAAIAFTLGVPGTPGTGNAAPPAPLTFNCTNGDLAAGAVTPGAGIASNFTVVVENAQCTNRNRCLCPDTTAGQERDNFVNIVVYGPKNLPAQGPVQIPVLTSGTLATLSMQVAAGAPSSIPLHIFNSVFDGSSVGTPRANLSIGDKAACDVTATGQRSNVSFTDGTVTVGGIVTPCVGDCDHSHVVTVNELILGVDIALGTQSANACVAFQDQSGMVTITQIIQGVNNALNGCPPAA